MMNLDFIDDSLNRETSPVSGAFVNANCGEFQRISVEFWRVVAGLAGLLTVSLTVASPSLKKPL